MKAGKIKLKNQLKNKIRFYFIVESELNYEEKNFNNYRFAY